MSPRIIRWHRLASAGLVLVLGCGGEPGGGGSGSGGASTGGAAGAASSGGTTGTGGLDGSGGARATGGSSATGGATGSGGAVASGGRGGATGSGGVGAAGGESGSGGAPATGGATGSGGTGGAGARGGASGSSGGGQSGGGGAGGRGNGGGGGAAGKPGAGGAAGGAAGTTGTGGGAAGGSGHTGPWRVMMLGDSVTESTCYPQLTYAQLMAGNHSNFQFVGMETTNQSCGGGAPVSVKDEGHAGYGVTYLPQNSTRGTCTKSSGCGSYAELQTWAAEKPDIVLMHFGTNDVWDGVATSTILSAYVAVLAEFRKQNPKVIFFVSKIIKLDPAGCGNCLTNVGALAAALTPAWATANATATSPVTIIDHYDSAFDPTKTADSADGVHPTPTGAAIMATVTYDAIVASGYF
jgi:lysophospholipase L1-like esterase